MKTPRSTRIALLLLTVALALCIAAAWHWRESPRVLTVAALAIVGVLIGIWHRTGLVQLELGLTDADFASGPLMSEERQMIRLLEARQEHAPVALFKVEDGRASPLNARARRIIAPGHVIDRAALFRSLARDGQASRQLIRYESEYGDERALAAQVSILVDQHLENLIALMPVESDLEAETLRAWQQLVRVLTHEIMNSLTPVASLSHTTLSLIEETSAHLPPPLYEDLTVALSAICRRADSLVQFVSSYRSLSAVPVARVERVRVAEMFSRLEALIAPSWAQDRGGAATFSVQPESLELIADPGQLEQSLLNLTKNAYEATAGQAIANLEVRASLSRGGRLRLEVIDDGPGVADSDVNQIFTPFFSTKANSTGIGLALVRQLVHNNGGSVRYAKRIQGGARFILTF